MAKATLRGHTVKGFLSREEADRARMKEPIAWDDEHVGLVQTTCCGKAMRITQREYEALITIWRWGTESFGTPMPT